jgi:hypothetical protein
MSSLVSDAERDSLMEDLNNTFDTFKRDIVVWKEPQQVPVQNSNTSGGVFGFGGSDVSQEFTYVPNSGVFQAVVRYASQKRVGQANVLQDTNVFIPVGEVKIKVTPECYDFIENGGKTDKISFDNRDWTFVGTSQAMPFMGTLYYMYQLKPKV